MTAYWPPLCELSAIASNNGMFRILHAVLIRMLREQLTLNLTRMHNQAGITAGHLMEQHLAVWQAIKSRQPEEGRAAMRRHIEYTWGSLREQEEPEQKAKRKKPSGRTA